MDEFQAGKAQWVGLQNDRTSIGAPLTTANNVSFYYAGEARARPGLARTAYSTTAAASTGLLEVMPHPSGASLGMFLVTAVAGTITGHAVLASGTTTIASGLSSLNRGCFARYGDRLYFTNDFDSAQAISSPQGSAVAAGLAPPAAVMGAAATAAGVTTEGVHLVRYRYYDARANRYSDASTPLEVEVAEDLSDAQLTFTVGTAATDIIVPASLTNVTHFIVEMTAAAGTEYYVVVQRALTDTSDVVINMTDAILATGRPATYYGDDGHVPPPLTAMCCEHRGRMFYFGAGEYSFTGCSVTNGSAAVTGTGFSTNWVGRNFRVGTSATTYTISAITATTITISPVYAGSTDAAATIYITSPTPDMLYWSRSGYPESTFPTRWARRALQGAGDVPTGVMSFFGDLYVFGKQTTRRFTYEKDPASAKIEHVPGYFGVYNQRCLVQAEGKVFGFGPSGVWMLAGIVPKMISAPVQVTLENVQANATEAVTKAYHAFYHAQERAVYFLMGITAPNIYVRYDLPTGIWTSGSWQQTHVASTTGWIGQTTTRGPVAALLLDANGYLWRMKEFTNDANGYIPTGNALVADAGSTTTVIPITGVTLPTTNLGLAGYYISVSDGAIFRLIASNTASTITLATALSSPPAAGDSLQVGRINSQLASGYLTGGGLETRRRPRYLVIKAGEIAGTEPAQLHVYKDTSGSAVTVTALATDTFPDGVTVTNGLTYISFVSSGSTLSANADRCIYIPMMADWSRTLRWLLQLATTHSLWSIGSIYFDYGENGKLDGSGE
jgi:hypothetical protein